MRRYRPRIADLMLKKKLAGKGAVLIEGPKWCGKTTTAEQLAQSVLYMADPQQSRLYMTMVDIQPGQLLKGAVPRLIDEWQLAPKLWDAIRFEVDHRDGLGQFILTGSAVPASYEEIHHAGTGRFAWLLMRPMSLYESGESSGDISLGGLFSGSQDIQGENPLKLEDLAFLCCRGGWPRAVDMDREIALEQAYDYYDAVVRSDISRVDSITRNPERARRLMRAYARNLGTQASLELLSKDVTASNTDSSSPDTVSSYLKALKKIFVVEDMVAWNPNLRSRTAIRSSDTRYFVDPSIAVAALGLGPEDLMADLKTFGFMFETMCIRDLRVYADALDGKVYHFRDKTGLECDAVVHLRNGKYGLIEIKLGGDFLIEEGAVNLKKLKEKIDTDKMKAPSFLMVLTATGRYVCRRPDGVWVVPVGCLKH